jgi:pimeloyl-ACP methyl ester carboxylesterase
MVTRLMVIFCGLALMGGNPASAGLAVNSDYVVLLHGLGRSAHSFSKMADVLRAAGYDVLNIDYPSTDHTIPVLTEKYVKPAIETHCTDDTRAIHFVTHSMGGILLREYVRRFRPDNLGRAVMLSPPSLGSEVVDFLRKNGIVRSIMGPAFLQLGTEPDSFVNLLPPVDFEVGVITGDRTINFINSMIIPGPDDGKVSVARARLPGMTTFKVVHRTHPLIMNADEVIGDVLRFLEEGEFRDAPGMPGVPGAEPPANKGTALKGARKLKTGLKQLGDERS